MTTTSIRHLLSKCKIHGTGDAQVIISDSELYVLLSISMRDLNWPLAEFGLSDIEIPNDYYQIPIKWFSTSEIPHANPKVLLHALDNAVGKHPDFALYIQNLCALHRRRVKYQRILETQPLAQADQIGPRSLLEFGLCDLELLFSWMTWRKWIYDIDNRSAQETGYLFEPILASCLGGEPIGARNSPVKRLDENGNSTKNGRQIDCFLAEGNLAYEFKLRVTIAASGQGRFSEELSFPRECRVAGFTPVLLVLDPTPSPRLTELAEAFINANGIAMAGEEAWEHIERNAGQILSVYVKKYIRPPIHAIEVIDNRLPLELNLSWGEKSILIASENAKYEIRRE